jgi:hypothetical protein
MKKPPGLTIEIDLVNFNSPSPNRHTHRHNNNSNNKTETTTRTTNNGNVNDINYQNMTSPTPTFRDEGLSIGRDFMRMEGVTICPRQSFPSLEEFTIERTLGKGISSVVQLASCEECRWSDYQFDCESNCESNFESNCEFDTTKISVKDTVKSKSKSLSYFALKIFPLLKEANQSRDVPIYKSNDHNHTRSPNHL